MFSMLGLLTLSMIFIGFCFEAPIMLGVSVILSAIGVTFCYVWSRFTWFGVMVWLVYLSAVLVMFLFFVSLAPNPDFSIVSGWSLVCASFDFSVIVLTFFFSDGTWSNTGNFESVGFCPLITILWSDSGAIFMAGLAAYLFFVVVVVSKLSSRSGGALRGIG